MKNLPIKIIFVIFMTIFMVKGSLNVIDNIIKNQKLDITDKAQQNEHEIRQSVSMISFSKNRSVFGYLGINKKPQLVFLQDESILGYNTADLTSKTGESNSINLCKIGEDKILVGYSIYDNTGPSEKLYFRLVDLETRAIDDSGEFDLGVIEDNYSVSMIQFSDNSVAVSYTVKLTGQDVYETRVITLDINTQVFSNAITVNSLAIKSEHNSNMSLVSKTQIIITFQGNQSTDIPIQDFGIQIQYLDINADALSKSVTKADKIQIENQKDFQYTNPQIIGQSSQSQTNLGFFLTWELESALYISKYNQNDAQGCIELIDTDSIFSSWTLYNDELYIMYQKQNILMIQVIDTQDCSQVSNSFNFTPENYTATKTSAIQISHSDDTTQYYTIISLAEKDAQLEFFYSQYFAQQNDVCDTLGCYGCNDTSDCQICGGSSIIIRQQLIRDFDNECNCIKGYFQDDNNIDCQQCSSQCESCDNSSTCFKCKDDQMLLPHCYITKKHNFQYTDKSGLIQYGECANKCLYCENKEDGSDTCIECDGQNRLPQKDNCACKEGYYDDFGKFKDCIQCPQNCLKCQSDQKCDECDASLDLILNNFSGMCECKRGYISSQKLTNKEYKEINKPFECLKCYQLQDGCVTECPSNTIQNEDLQLCEIVSVSLVSNAVLIVIITLITIIFQVVIMKVLHSKLKEKYNQFMNVQLDEQMKIKQQRQLIYQNFDKESGNSFSETKNNSNTNNNNIFSSTSQNNMTESPLKRRQNRRQVGRNSASNSKQQSQQQLDDSSSVMGSQINLMQDQSISSIQGNNIKKFSGNLNQSQFQDNMDIDHSQVNMEDAQNVSFQKKSIKDSPSNAQKESVDYLVDQIDIIE